MTLSPEIASLDKRDPLVEKREIFPASRSTSLSQALETSVDRLAVVHSDGGTYSSDQFISCALPFTDVILPPTTCTHPRQFSGTEEIARGDSHRSPRCTRGDPRSLFLSLLCPDDSCTPVRSLRLTHATRVHATSLARWHVLARVELDICIYICIHMHTIDSA